MKDKEMVTYDRKRTTWKGPLDRWIFAERKLPTCAYQAEGEHKYGFLAL